MPPPTRRDPLLPAEGPATNSTMSATNNGSHMANTVESWVEIASQPSSSSLSSIADEIVITGLRVGTNATGVNGGAMPVTAQQQPQRRRRLLQQVEQVEAAAGRPPTSHPTNLPSTTPANSNSGAAPRSSAGSSQEEYDETESEEDRVLSSSTEHLDMADVSSRPPQSYSLMQYQAAQARLRQRAAASDGDDEDDDDDDDGTALGILSSGPPTFRPQPNAFSHPPTHLQQHQPQLQPTASHRSVPTPHHMAAGGPYAPRSSRPARNSAPNFMSPSYREDNDAALRASLTTLLSCAAAARGLPKKENNGIGGFVVAGGGEPSSSQTNTGVRPSNQPMGLRLVPESELVDDNDNEAPVSPRTRTSFQPPRVPPQVSSSNTQPTARPSASSSSTKQHAASSSTQQHQQQHHSSRNSAVSAVSTSSKSKRTGASKSSPRVTKKKRTSSATATEGDGVTMISPTLLTWVVSAGVVVLVSVVGFGAGFVIGREVGRQEAASSMSAAAAGSSMPANSSAASASTACGREIMRSSTGSTLRRFRWGGMTKSVAA